VYGRENAPTSQQCIYYITYSFGKLLFKMGECRGEGIGNDIVSWAAAGGETSLMKEADSFLFPFPLHQYLLSRKTKHIHSPKKILIGDGDGNVKE
jgi:hypothetical protein